MTQIDIDPLLLNNVTELDKQLKQRIRSDLLPEIFKIDKQRGKKLDSELEK